MKTYIVSILLLFFYLTVHAQDETGLHIPFIEKEALIDGKPSDEVWASLPAFSGFKNHFPIDKGMAERQTEVKMFHNGKSLYIAAIYHDGEERNNISSLKRDNYFEGMHLSDCFGVVLDPYGDGNNGYFFAVNAGGVQFDALIGNINERNDSWNTIWESQVSQEGTDKYYELAIPLDAINFNPDKAYWGVQLYSNDTKLNQYTAFEYRPRNFLQFDLRFTKKMKIEKLPKKVSNKFSLLPSLAYNYTKDEVAKEENSRFTPSLDAQYNITPSLRLDATINPDFSQVEVDQQVTNLTRFAINFPERRKFFLENSDLFNNLGTSVSNPFYSRRIGAETDILAGLKLSGNLGNKTRIGLLNVQTKDQEDIKGTNYSVLVGQQSLSEAFTATAYWVNKQQEAIYNRVGGVDVNFKSKNNKWTSNANYALAFDKENNGENAFWNLDVAYQTRTFDWNVSWQEVGKNHNTEMGFTPLLFNYDALTGQTIREGFSVAYAEMQWKYFPEKSKHIDWSRRFWLMNRATLNEDGSLRENWMFLSPFAIRFKNTAYVYATVMNQEENLRYNFDFLQNGNPIQPGNYNYTYGRVGYWSPNNQKFYYNIKLEYGQFYEGTRLNPAVTLIYRLLPKAVVSLRYAMNDVHLNGLGEKTFHLAQLTTEIYFSNSLNWTTYVQYNTQIDNFNINSRIQWEYKPLSFVYFVVSDNLYGDFGQKNWGLSLKINRRFDF